MFTDTEMKLMNQSLHILVEIRTLSIFDSSTLCVLIFSFFPSSHIIVLSFFPCFFCFILGPCCFCAGDTCNSGFRSSWRLASGESSCNHESHNSRHAHKCIFVNLHSWRKNGLAPLTTAEVMKENGLAHCFFPGLRVMIEYESIQSVSAFSTVHMMTLVCLVSIWRWWDESFSSSFWAHHIWFARSSCGFCINFRMESAICPSLVVRFDLKCMDKEMCACSNIFFVYQGIYKW